MFITHLMSLLQNEPHDEITTIRKEKAYDNNYKFSTHS